MHTIKRVSDCRDREAFVKDLVCAIRLGKKITHQLVGLPRPRPIITSVSAVVLVYLHIMHPLLPLAHWACVRRFAALDGSYQFPTRQMIALPDISPIFAPMKFPRSFSFCFRRATIRIDVGHAGIVFVACHSCACGDAARATVSARLGRYRRTS